jgi:hypothetical protein
MAINMTSEIHRRNANIALNYIKDIDYALSHHIGDKQQLRQARKFAVRMQQLSRLKADFLISSTKRKLWLMVKAIPIFPAQSVRFALIIAAPSLYKKRQLRNLGIS